MDFKSLISKLDSMEAPPATPAAPELPKAIQLNEDAQLRVLAGTSSILEEAKKMKKDEKKEEKEEKVDEAAEKTPSEWTDKSGKKHPATKVKGGKYTGKEAEKDDKKSKKDESVDPDAFKEKFSKMIEAAKPDFLDLDKDGNKKEPMKSAAKSKGGEKKDGKKGMSDKQAKYFGKKNESKMMPKGKKRPVKESVEGKLTFKDMVKLVHESGGQQQIDPIDAELFAWATRVAKNKFQESVKAEIYAGLVYERMGGVFQMYDVLAEEKK